MAELVNVYIQSLSELIKDFITKNFNKLGVAMTEANFRYLYREQAKEHFKTLDFIGYIPLEMLGLAMQQHLIVLVRLNPGDKPDFYFEYVDVLLGEHCAYLVKHYERAVDFL
jgi:hypothetical protein